MSIKTQTLSQDFTSKVVDQTSQDLKNAVLIVSIGVNVTILVTWLALRLVGA